MTKLLPEPKPITTWFRCLGILPIVFYLVHPFRIYVLGGSPAEALWFCHLGNLVLASGMFMAWPRLVGVSTSWLIFGTSMWTIDMLAGGHFYFTSLLMHVGGLGLAVFATFKLGFEKRTWLLATVSMVILQLMTRIFTPAEFNVNLAFRVWKGWEHMFPSYLLYMVLIYSAGIAGFIGIELVFRRLLKCTNQGRI